MTDTIKLVHKLISITHTHQIKLVELASMHNGLYISEKTTKPLSTTLAWTCAIFILPGYTYLPPGMDLALVLGSNHVLVSDTHTYRFTIQTDSCNNIINEHVDIFQYGIIEPDAVSSMMYQLPSMHLRTLICPTQPKPPNQTGKARCMSSSSRSVTACPCAACRCSRGARRRGAASPSTRRSPPRKPPPPPPLLPSSADAGHERLALADIRSNRDL